MGCLSHGKYSRQFQDDAIRTARIHHAFIPVTGLKCLHGKIFSPLTEIPVGKTKISWTEPACPLIMDTSKILQRIWRQGEISVNPVGSYGEALSQASIVSRYLCCRVVTSIYVAFEDCDFLVEDFFVWTSFYGSPWSHSLYASSYHKKGFALSPVLKVRVLELEMTYTMGGTNQKHTMNWIYATHEKSPSYVFRYAGEFRKQLTGGSEGWSKGNLITKALSCNKFRSH